MRETKVNLFLPLFLPEFFSGILKAIYKKGIKIYLNDEELDEQSPLARMQESKILINTNHPAFARASANKEEKNIIIFAVALTLSRFLETAHLPQDFIDNFLAAWGKEEQKTQLSF